jgi:hypothetical protein
MRRLEGGGNGGGQGYGGSGPRKPDRSVDVAARTPAQRFYLWTALTALSFLSHIAFLALIEPLKVFSMTKANAYAYSGVPLVFGLICLLFAILNFRKITPRTEIHIAVLLVTIVFGSLNFQGAGGIVWFFAREPLRDAFLGG